MKRLLKISFDIFLTSFSAILVWFFVGIILDKNLTNTFSLTYSMQCVMGIFISIFGHGANILKFKSNDERAVDNGIFWGSIFSILFFSIMAVFAGSYIEFMQMDIEVYLVFCRYSMLQIMLQAILQLILTKLYYLEQNTKANKLVIAFNLINLVFIALLSLITKNQVVITSITIVVLAIFVLIVFIKNVTYKNINFKLNILSSIKYDSISFVNYIMFFIIYFFGFSNSFAFGEEYVVAITFSTFVTDVEWDMTTSIETVAKIDIAKNKMNVKEHTKNSIKLITILVIMVLVLSLISYPIYKPNLEIVPIFLTLHIISFFITSIYLSKQIYLQLEWSGTIITAITIISFILRTSFSFVPTPYCTILGQVIQGVICIFVYLIIFMMLKKKGKLKNDIAIEETYKNIKSEKITL